MQLKISKAKKRFAAYNMKLIGQKIIAFLSIASRILDFYH